VPVALLSVASKDGVESFARSLVALKWDILATPGTHDALTHARVTSTNLVTALGGPPTIGARVVTIAREVHAALLADATATHEAELRILGIPRIDLVDVRLEPFAPRLDKGPPCTAAEADVGGVALLRSAAKGQRIVISDDRDRDNVLAWLRAGQPDDARFRARLIARAELLAAYHSLLSAWFHSDGTFSVVRIKASEPRWPFNEGD
jgi:phosphoribosylaminoimidazolecarboxamide formyltransferase / IMP cyclohydrolase